MFTGSGFVDKDMSGERISGAMTTWQRMTCHGHADIFYALERFPVKSISF